MSVTINGSNTPTAGGVTYGDGSNYATTSAGAAGGVLYSAGSSAPAFTAAGTSGQVLTSAGSGAPTWTTPSAGALTLLTTQTVSSPAATITVSTGFSSTYNEYQLVFTNIKRSTAATAGIGIQIYTDGTYGWTSLYSDATTGSTSSNNTSADQIRMTGGGTQFSASSADPICSGVLYVLNANVGASISIVGQQSTQRPDNNGITSYTNFFGTLRNYAAVTQLRFVLTDGGNFSSGILKLYGVSK